MHKYGWYKSSGQCRYILFVHLTSTVHGMNVRCIMHDTDIHGMCMHGPASALAYKMTFLYFSGNTFFAQKMYPFFLLKWHMNKIKKIPAVTSLRARPVTIYTILTYVISRETITLRTAYLMKSKVVILLTSIFSFSLVNLWGTAAASAAVICAWW